MRLRHCTSELLAMLSFKGDWGNTSRSEVGGCVGPGHLGYIWSSSQSYIGGGGECKTHQGIPESGWLGNILPNWWNKCKA